MDLERQLWIQLSPHDQRWFFTIRRFIVTQIWSNLVHRSWNFGLFRIFHLSHERIFAGQNERGGELFFVKRKLASINYPDGIHRYVVMDSVARKTQLEKWIEQFFAHFWWCFKVLQCLRPYKMGKMKKILVHFEFNPSLKVKGTSYNRIHHY